MNMNYIRPAEGTPGRLLTEIESKALLKEIGIPVVETLLAKSKAEAVDLSRKLLFPVALKVVSPDIIHKSDIGGVKLGLRTSKQVESAYDEILSVVRLKCPEANVEGVSVQKMARRGTEVIIGMTRDEQFGHVLMFGLGGVLVELLKDVTFGIVPLERKDAQRMIREIKGYPLLNGFRGSETVDQPALEEMLLKVSRFVDQRPEISEIDINPVFAYGDGAIAVDARVILSDS
ncbi:MAG: acetyl-CoA synthetase [Desulfobacteraceae bacterium]|nr:MAG: acetyl-CoA synthetase [Desulfobacteraceae bacterium]